MREVRGRARKKKYICLDSEREMQKSWSWRSLQQASEFSGDCDEVSFSKFAPVLSPVLLFLFNCVVQPSDFQYLLLQK